MDSYDKWKLGLNKDDRCECDYCNEKFDNLYETTGGDFICDDCSEGYEMCTKCDDIITTDQLFGHSEYCDSCCEYLADRSVDND